MTKKANILIGLFALTALSASAAIVAETEASLASTNNSVATAQSINGSFTAPPPGNVFSLPGISTTATIQGIVGGNDVDYFSFTNTIAGSQLFLDVDNTPATFDSIVAVFNPFGTLIGWGDDTNPADPGSASSIDAILGPITLSAVGTYYIAISEFANYPSAALLFSEAPLGLGGFGVAGATPGLSSFDLDGVQPADGAAYTLNATLATPEPATLSLMGLALLGVGFMKYRRS